MNKKDLIAVSDLTDFDIIKIFEVAKKLKEKLKKGELVSPLKGKTLGMIFQKSSTRTRVSFEVGISQLGGMGIFLNTNDLQLGRSETIKDTALTLSRYLDCIMIRAKNHNDVIEFARYASIPIINGLTNLLHPCQALSDLYTIIEHTIIEHKKTNIKNIKTDIKDILPLIKELNIVFIGDGNNVSNSLISLCSKLGANIAVCCPAGYNPDSNILNRSLETAKKTGSKINVIHNFNNDDNDTANDILKSADFLYTDVWTSMGQEEEALERGEKFKGYQINQKLINKSKPGVKVMHCLPAYRGKEITDEIMDGPHSIIFDQAENRLHVQKAIMYLLMTKN